MIYPAVLRSKCSANDSFTSDTDTSGSIAPCDAPGAYPVFWNVGGCAIWNSGQRCNASTRDKLVVDVTKFGILGANWTQTNIPTLQAAQGWQPSFRKLMPVSPGTPNQHTSLGVVYMYEPVC